jgi:hypothetical protein
MADEVEYRFHSLQQNYPNDNGGPTFLQVTWSKSEELANGLVEVRKQLGCQSKTDGIVPNTKSHVDHNAKSRNCSSYILQDLAYRRLMQYNQEIQAILFRHHPQRVDDEECMDTRDEFMSAIHSSPGETLDNWVVPD